MENGRSGFAAGMMKHIGGLFRYAAYHKRRAYLAKRIAGFAQMEAADFLPILSRSIHAHKMETHAHRSKRSRMQKGRPTE